MAEFYSQKFTTNDKQLYFIKEKNEYWGLVCYIVKGNVADSPLAAVYPEKWNQGALKHIKRERFNFALRNNIQFTTNGARLDNLASQCVFEKVGMKKIGADHIFHILPFLGLTGQLKRSEVNKPIEENIYTYCEERLREHIKPSKLPHLFTKTFRTQKSFGQSFTEIEQSIPVSDDDRLLAVTKLFTETGLHSVVHMAFSQ